MKNIKGFLKIALLLLIIFTACIPITFSVSNDGKIAFVRAEGAFWKKINSKSITTLYKTKSGDKAQFVQLTSNGRKALIVLKKKWKKPAVYTVNSDGSSLKKLYPAKSSTIGFSLWASNNRNISVTEQGKKNPKLGKTLAVLKSINAVTGAARILARDVIYMHQWLGSQNIAIIKIVKKYKIKSTKYYRAELLIVDIRTGRKRRIAKLVTKSTKISMTTDKRRNIAVSALALTKIGRTLPKLAKYPKLKLFVVSSSGHVKKLNKDNATLGVFSPNGRKLMVVYKDGKQKVGVISSSLRGRITTIDKRTTTSYNSADLVPSWYGNNAVIYFKEIDIIGSNGKAIHAFIKKINGSAVKNLQAEIDYLISNKFHNTGSF